MKANRFGFFKKGYLLLERKEGQGFHIDAETEVVIAKIEGNKAFVAIKAPNRRVVRNEILDKAPRTEEGAIEEPVAASAIRT
jgi:sRNA-binding carbon storage regulator CsrA